MGTARRKIPDDETADLAARAAWLHFVGGLTQSEVASRLDLSPTRAHRAIARAQALGFVHISVEAAAAPCALLEDRLMQGYGLSMCRVAMDLPEPGPMPLTALGALGAQWLGRLVETNAHEVIGVSHGRTIAAMVEAMRRQETDTAFVSLLGGLTRSLAANPYDVIHRLAQKTGAEAYLMPAPLFTDTREDRDMLVGQSLLSGAFDRMETASLAVVGIGDLVTSAGIAEAGREEPDLIASLREGGAVAEILGQFIDGDGRILSTPFDGRTIAFPLESLRSRDCVAIAGGESKTEAIRAVLRSGLLTGLIIDEATARRLVGALEGGEALAAQ